MEADQLDMAFYAVREAIKSDILLNKKISKNDYKKYVQLGKEMNIRGIEIKNPLPAEKIKRFKKESYEIDESVDRLMNAINLGDNKKIEPLDSKLVDLGHEDIVFQKLEIDAREKFQQMNSYARDLKNKDMYSEEYEIFKEEWKIAKQKVIDYELKKQAEKSVDTKTENNEGDDVIMNVA